MPVARGRWSAPVFRTALAYAATCTLFVIANTMTTAGNAIFIQNTAPIWVLILAPSLVGERPTRAEKLSVPLSLAGCLLFFADDLSTGRLLGNLAALGASVSYALLIIGYRKLSRDEGLTATVAGNAIIVVACLFPALSGPAPTVADLGVVLYLGAIQQAAAAVLFTRGIRGVSALEGSLLTLFEPVLSPLWAFLIVGETLGPLALLGAAIILGTMVWRASSSPATA
jgi:drug/metabolite transporter (DMT)-like permease